MRRALLAGLAAIPLLLAPLADRPALAQATAPGDSRTFTVLSINDVYRIAGLDGGERGGLARVRTLRRQIEETDGEMLLLHAGDLLYPSFLSRAYDGAQMVSVLNLLNGDGGDFDEGLFVAFGNHEFDKGRLKHAEGLNSRVRESQFTWLGTNIRFASDGLGKPLVAGRAVEGMQGATNLIDSAVVTVNGVNVGLFAVTTPVNWPAYVIDFGDPVEVARRTSALLRAQGAEVVIAVTHLNMAEDRALMSTLGAEGPNLVVGGHEHVRQLWIGPHGMVIKADADAISAAVIQVTVAGDGSVSFAPRFETLGGAQPEPDPDVLAAVQGWEERRAAEFCGTLDPPEPTDCLTKPLSHAGVDLVAEESEIRAFETNLGDWILDRALEAFRDEGAEVAFLNAGSLRLNQNISQGQPVTRRTVEEIFAYPTGLRLIEIDGATLRQVLAHALVGWPGHGRWLQVAGMAYRVDPGSGLVDDVKVMTPKGLVPLGDDETVRAVTGTYLLDRSGDQDGYTMLGEEQIVPGSTEGLTLKSLVVDALIAAGDAGIAPRLEGRICHAARSGPCLLIQR